MASTALPALRATRQPFLQRAAALMSSSPIFRSSISPYTSLSLSAACAVANTSTTISVALSPSSPSSLTYADLIPDTLAGLRDLLPGWVLAVPKSRTTHGAKRMRSANKGLKEKQNLVSCPSCGAPKLAHHLCHDCHVAFRREIHREAKEAKQQPPRV
ncbi:hypothetical protein JCM8547_001046 [Rhodosporidiobolus lusitaniae]